MESVLAVVIGMMFAAGIYLILATNLMRLIVGLALVSNAANLMIFTSGRLIRHGPPIIPEQSQGQAQQFANALPQALILTAIVIGFGMLALALILAYRAHEEFGESNPNTITRSEESEGER